jgi:hypothetical protein
MSLTFSAVVQAGIAAVTTTSSGPMIPPAFILGSSVPVYFNVETTAQINGLIQVCIDYGLWSDSFTRPQMLYFDNAGNVTNVTTSLNSAQTTVCGSVPSLSNFTVALADGKRSQGQVTSQ